MTRLANPGRIARLLRTYAAQVEALRRLRNGGSQFVRVEHENGIPSVHPLTGTELRALRRLQREQEPGRYVFLSERGAPMSAVGFRRMITRLGKAAKMPFSVHLTCSAMLQTCQ